MNGKKTAILIPCYNEEKTIANVIKGFRKALPHADIYVYDNNSTDRTAELATMEGAIVKKESRQGKGFVVRSMFHQIDADCYILVDGDDTYPPEAAKELEKAILEDEYDMVIGDRLSSTYFMENKRKFHNGGNKAVRFLINHIFKANIRDIMTGYRSFSRLFVKSFPILSHGFEIETEMTIHALDKNFKIMEVPVQYRNRPEGSVSKLNTISDGIRVMKTIAVLYRDYKPLEFFSLFSLAGILISTIFFIPILQEYLRTGLVAKFPTLIVCGVVMTISILLFICGIILHVISKKHRQLYELFLLKI